VCQCDLSDDDIFDMQIGSKHVVALDMIDRTVQVGDCCLCGDRCCCARSRCALTQRGNQMREYNRRRLTEPASLAPMR
jgi:hypothetical protein